MLRKKQNEPFARITDKKLKVLLDNIKPVSNKAMSDYIISYNAHSDVLGMLLGSKSIMNLNQYDLFRLMEREYRKKLEEYEDQREELVKGWEELKTQSQQEDLEVSSKPSQQKSSKKKV